jgi:hypothetical protein
MSADLLFAFLPSADNVGRFVISVLAVAGAAFLGGLSVGFLTNLLARALTAKPVPRPALLFVRLLGAVVAGVLAAMVLFSSGGGGGGWGWGGGGGTGLGTGKGNGSVVSQDKKDKDRREPDRKKTDKEGEPRDKNKALRIEVVVAPQSEGRSYRLEGEQQLRTRDEVANALDERRKENPALEKVIIVLYTNSPDPKTTVVQELVRLVENKSLSPDILLDAGKAP